MRSKHDSTTRGWQTPQLRLLLASSDGVQQLYNPVLSFVLSSFPLLFLSFLSAPSTPLLCRALCLSLCVRRALTQACFGPWREWSAPWHRHFRADKHTHTHAMDNARVQNNQVTICCASVWCLLGCVGVCCFFSCLSWAKRLVNTHPFVSVCSLLNWLPLSLFSAPHALLHSSQPQYLGETLTKLSYYRRGNLPGTVISNSLVQFNRLVKAVINQLFTQPLLVYYEEQK